MLLLYTDETNLDPASSAFFVYGGVAVSSQKAGQLHDAIEKIRCDHNVPPEYQLKFNPGPTHLEHNSFIELKKAVIAASVDAGCKILVSLLHHKIATSVDEGRRNELNRVTYHFNCLLSRLGEHGLVLVDRFSDKQIDSHLRNNFSVGVTGLPYSSNLRLDRIVGFHYAAIGQSHFSSVVDLLLGSLRFCVNAHSSKKEAQLPTARVILSGLAPLFFEDALGSGVSELSFFFSPKIIKAPAYRKDYEELKGFFGGCGITLKQSITDERTY